MADLAPCVNPKEQVNRPAFSLKIVNFILKLS